jgi:hypothetical protein
MRRWNLSRDLGSLISGVLCNYMSFLVAFLLLSTECSCGPYGIISVSINRRCNGWLCYKEYIASIINGFAAMQQMGLHSRRLYEMFQCMQVITCYGRRFLPQASRQVTRAFKKIVQCLVTLRFIRQRF